MRQEYKLEFFTNFVINFCICVLFCMLLILVYKAFSVQPKDIIPMGLLFVVALSLFGYLVKTKIDFMQDKFKSIIIDNDTKSLIFMSKKGEIANVKFDDIQYIHMITGEILRGVRLGHVKVLTKDGFCLSLVISNVNAFNVNLPSSINRNLEECLFFRVNK